MAQPLATRAQHGRDGRRSHPATSNCEVTALGARRLRIVSLYPAATEMICGLGLGDSLVGVSHECHWPPSVEGLPRLTRARIDVRATSGAIDAEVRSLVAAGEPLYDLDGAALAALEPTLVVAQDQCDVCALSSATVRRTLGADAALSSVNVVSLNPSTFDDVLGDIRRIAAAAQVSQVGERYVAALRARLAAVQRGMADAADRRRPRVAVIEWIDPLMVAGHWTPGLVSLAGGDHGLTADGAPSRCVPWAEFCDYAPELIVVAPCGFDLPRTEREATALGSAPGWAELPAVQHGCVRLADGDAYFSRPGPRLVDAVEMLSNWIDDILKRGREPRDVGGF